jgi:radical SAM protein with 4Fe4S-binding SPASM domain
MKSVSVGQVTRFLPHDSIPHLCHIELTYRCNERCRFCYNPKRPRVDDSGFVDEVVDRVAASQIPHVYLIGGEPSLVPERKLNTYIDILAPHSSVTIVTNGLRCLQDISNKLACFGVPIHGATKEMHEFLTQCPGGFAKTIATIKHYVSAGHDVRCIPVLTGYNYNQIYDIIALADSLGMESIYVDRYENGGLGAINVEEHELLKPSTTQFAEALTQMIRARTDFPSFEGRIGFGTAIPYCIDERLVTENLTSNCGVGTYFCAVTPAGDVRLCNQSEIVFGNVLTEPLEVIWNKTEIDTQFRSLDWADEPCKSCELLLDCAGGCKVDTACSNTFCIDYAVRGLTPPTVEYVSKLHNTESAVVYPIKYRVFRPNRYLKLTTRYSEKFMVTRYQTVKLDAVALAMVSEIRTVAIADEEELVTKFGDSIDLHDIRRFVSQLADAGAIDIIGGLP